MWHYVKIKLMKHCQTNNLYHNIENAFKSHVVIIETFYIKILLLNCCTALDMFLRSNAAAVLALFHNLGCWELIRQKTQTSPKNQTNKTNKRCFGFCFFPFSRVVEFTTRNNDPHSAPANLYYTPLLAFSSS